jgi:hypothetical protein
MKEVALEHPAAIKSTATARSSFPEDYEADARRSEALTLIPCVHL